MNSKMSKKESTMQWMKREERKNVDLAWEKEKQGNWGNKKIICFFKALLLRMRIHIMRIRILKKPDPDTIRTYF